MAKAKVAPKRPTPKALRIDQLTVVWNDGNTDHRIAGRHVALALALAYGEISNGLGCWTYFTDEAILTGDLECLEDVAVALGAAAADEMEGGLKILADNLRRVRLRMTIAKCLDRLAESYRVEVAAAATAVA